MYEAATMITNVNEDAVPGNADAGARIDICSCTYRRPALLNRMLTSVLRQETRGAFDFSVIVIDNDSGSSAESVVAGFMSANRRIVYDVEPERNISLARNRALSHASGDFVAIIDDDEEADPMWLYHLYRAMIRYDADVVFGPVSRRFDVEPPAYVMRSGAFTFPNPPTGSESGYTWAGNALIRRSALLRSGVSYDPRFGRTGGGDSDLYLELRRRGCKLVWCAESRVREYVPPERANLRWILKRDFRIGNNTDRINRRPPATVRELFGGLFRTLGAAMLNAVKQPDPWGSVDPALRSIRRCSWWLGRIAYRVGFQYEEYSDRAYSSRSESSRVAVAAPKFAE